MYVTAISIGDLRLNSVLGHETGMNMIEHFTLTPVRCAHGPSPSKGRA